MKRRADIQVLRAVAVLAVVVYHLNSSALRGGFVGVDIFFVISGYLITAHLLRDTGSSAPRKLISFYAARARRLLPAATTVLITIGYLTPYVLPDTRWRTTSGDLAASALYVENWALAQRSVDYLAQDDAPSIVQHFWTLSVEEQFYFGWPVLVIAVAAIATWRSRARSVQRVSSWFAVVALGIVLVSLLLSIVYTAHNPSRAYFVTFTRVWELAIGATVAAMSVAGASQKLPVVVSRTAQVAGFSLIAVSLVALSARTPYPGVIALLPTLGAALVLLGGERLGGDDWARLKPLRPVGLIGNWSYSIYLWHWPIVVALSVRGLLETWWGITVAIVLTAVFSGLCYRFVESLRFSAVLRRPVVALGVAAATTVLILGQAGVMTTTVDKAEVLARQAQSIFVQGLPTAANQASGPPQEVGGGFVPATLIAYDDWSACPTAGVDQASVVECSYGTRRATGSVVVVGDSHIKQWLPALVPAARSLGLSLTAYIHDSCPFISGPIWRTEELPLAGSPFSACMSWNTAVSKRVAETKNLRLLVTSSYGNSVDAVAPGRAVMEATAEAELARGLATALGPTVGRGIATLQIHDTPRMGRPIPDCVASLGVDSVACRRPLVDAQSRHSGATVRAFHLLAKLPGGRVAQYVDLNQYICPQGECRPVSSAMLVYRDSNHLTATFARSLLPVVAEVMRHSIASKNRD